MPERAGERNQDTTEKDRYFSTSFFFIRRRIRLTEKGEIGALSRKNKKLQLKRIVMKRWVERWPRSFRHARWIWSRTVATVEWVLAYIIVALKRPILIGIRMVSFEFENSLLNIQKNAFFKYIHIRDQNIAFFGCIRNRTLQDCGARKTMWIFERISRDNIA